MWSLPVENAASVVLGHCTVGFGLVFSLQNKKPNEANRAAPKVAPTPPPTAAVLSFGQFDGVDTEVVIVVATTVVVVAVIVGIIKTPTSVAKTCELFEQQLVPLPRFPKKNKSAF
jgi:hypothetical protein